MSRTATIDPNPDNAAGGGQAGTLARPLAAGAVAGALWAASGLLNWYLVFQRSTVHHEIVDAIAPATFARQAALGPLGVVTAIVAAVFVAAFTAAFTALAMGCRNRRHDGSTDARPGRVQTLFAAWFGSVLAGTLAAFSIAIGQSVQAIPHAFIANGAEWPWPAVIASSYWGVVAGWVPGLVAVIAERKAVGRDMRQSCGLETAAPGRNHLTSAHAIPMRIIIGVAIASVVALASASFAAESAAWAENHAVQPGIARPSSPPPTTTSTPTPTGTPTPVPAAEQDEARCSAENARITIGPTEAALGHRALTMYLTNAGSTACDAFGYPSIVFRTGGDAAANITVSPGISYMATDPGAAKIPLAPGATAKAVLSWGAGQRLGAEGSVSGLSIAGVTGASGVPFDLALDLADGGTATLTAWQPMK